MKVFNHQKIKLEKAECCTKTYVRLLIAKEMGAENFSMLLFEMEPDGYSPLHKHPSEHQIFVLQGEGTLFNGEKTTSIKAGDVVFIGSNEHHQFKNNNGKPLKFLSMAQHNKV